MSLSFPHPAMSWQRSTLQPSERGLGLFVHGPDVGVLDGEEHEAVRVLHEQRLGREVLVRPASSRFFISDAPLGTKRALRTGELCADLA